MRNVIVSKVGALHEAEKIKTQIPVEKIVFEENEKETNEIKKKDRC